MKRSTLSHSFLNIILVFIESALTLLLRLDPELRKAAYPLAKQGTVVALRLYLPHVEVFATFSTKGVLLDAELPIDRSEPDVIINAYSIQVINAITTHDSETTEKLQMRGESVQLRFLVPSRKQFFPVQLRRMGSADWNGIRAERLRMKLDTWFGFAVPEVTLVYARDGRRLLEFNGTGNLRDGRGRNPQVRIAFQTQAQLASASDLAGVARLPLDGRCSF